MTSDQLAQVISALQKAQGFQIGAWKEVQRIARQWAQMKAHGSYIDTGDTQTRTVSDSERPRYVEMFKDNLLLAIERAFLEDALAGQTFAEQIQKLPSD